MSLHFGPRVVLTGSPRPRKTCVSAMRRGDVTVNARWAARCSKVAIKKQNIQIAQHDDVDVQISMLDAVGNPLDISGFASLTWIVAENVKGDMLITKTTTNGSLLLPNATTAIASLTSAETGALQAGNLYHELRGINSGGEQQTMMAGSFAVEDTRISD